MDRIVPCRAQVNKKVQKKKKKKLRNAWLTWAHGRAGESRTGYVVSTGGLGQVSF